MCVGGVRSSALHKEAITLFHWAESRLLSIQTEHIKGQDNIQADWLNCKDVHPGELSLKREVFAEIVAHFGHPDVDLLASHENHQVPQFFVRYYHPRVEGLDALTSGLAPRSPICVPPIPLIPKVIRNIREQKSKVILMAPWWPHRPWFSVLLQLVRGNPLRLHPSSDMLHQGPIFHPHPHRLLLLLFLFKILY